MVFVAGEVIKGNAFQTIILTFKIIHSSKPKYLSDKLEFDERNYLLRDGINKLKKVNYKLNQSREGFIYRAITLFNMLDQKLRQETNLRVFKSEARIWVEKNVSETKDIINTSYQ